MYEFKRCLVLGRSCFQSKKGTTCYSIQLAIPYESKRGEGYSCQSFFVSEGQYNDFKDFNFPTSMLMDIRYINGGNALLGYDVASEDQSALWA